jgi:hypothetical protein
MAASTSVLDVPLDTLDGFSRTVAGAADGGRSRAWSGHTSQVASGPSTAPKEGVSFLWEGVRWT